MIFFWGDNLAKFVLQVKSISFGSANSFILYPTSLNTLIICDQMVDSVLTIHSSAGVTAATNASLKLHQNTSVFFFWHFDQFNSPSF